MSTPHRHSSFCLVPTPTLALLTLILTAAISPRVFASPAAQPPKAPAATSDAANAPTSWPVMELKARRVAIDPATGARHELEYTPRMGETSPDATKRLVINSTRGGKPFVLSVSTLIDKDNPHAGAPSAEAKRVASLDSEISEAHWLSDSRHTVFQSGSGATSIAWIIDTDAANPTPKRLLDTTKPTRTPTVSRDGKVAVLVETKHVGKARHADLVVLDAPLASPPEKPRVVASDLHIFSVVWSSDSSRLAFSTIDEILLWNAKDASTDTLRYDSAGPAQKPNSAPSDGFFNCATSHLAFSPDDTQLACTPRFVGGRFIDKNDPDAGRLYSDDKVVVFNLLNTMAPIVLSGDDHILGLSWISKDAAIDESKKYDFQLGR